MKDLTGIFSSFVISLIILMSLNECLTPISYFSPKVFSLLKPFLLPKGYFNYKACQDLQTFLKGKTVAIVGPAASFEGSHYGPEIDGHDVVVRVNSGVFDDEAFKNDFGSRTDVLVAVFNPGNQQFLNNFLSTWRKVKYFVVMDFRSGDLFDNLKDESVLVRNISTHTLSMGAIHCSLVDSFFTEFKTRLYMANTGIATLVFLKTTQLSRVDIYGFDFYGSGYHRWLNDAHRNLISPSSPASFKQILDDSAKAHNQTRQYSFFTTHLLSDNRFFWKKPK